MKKIKNKKFNFEKFEVAKLKNLKLILGGDGTEGGDGPKTTGTDKPVRTITSISDQTGTTV